MIENIEDGFEAYKTYLAVKQHFTSNSYDFTKYHGKVNAKLETFLKRKDKFFFRKIEKTYEPEELVKFYVSNFILNNNNWHGNLTNGEARENYEAWKERLSNIDNAFVEDLKKCKNFCKIRNLMPNDLVRVVDGQHPYLLKMHLKEDINIETLMMLDSVLNFMSHWKTELNDIVFEEFEKKYRKYQPFVKFNTTQCRLNIVENLL